MCSLRSCMELIEGDGIGLLREEEGHETWQCIRDHYCAADAADPWFCFVYHEAHSVLTPLGHNSQLKLVSPAPCACNCCRTHLRARGFQICMLLLRHSCHGIGAGV